ncbi:MAG: trimethylamine methyltransferase family protein [candidate division KSB1 bacterium]|nr:trimethylamine methyltransferase family protein [candidate division KSB1 bacterium]
MEQRPFISIISEQLVRRVIDEAMDVLEKVGVMVEHEEGRRLLTDAGARSEPGFSQIKIPRGLVEQSIASAPKAITIYDRAGEPAMQLEADRVHFDPGSAALTILDWKTQKERTPVTADLVALARLTDSLPHLAAQSTGLIPGDVPGAIADRYRLYIALLHGRKPIVTGTFAVDAFEVMWDMLVAVRGSREELHRKPLAIFDCCPSPPLKWSRLTCQCLIDCARAGIPAELVSMPLTGATAPATLLGALVQHTAETLSGVVINQLAQPGAPVIYGGSPSAMDMRTGTTPMGAIETMMLDVAYAAVGKHFSLPTHAYMALSDAKVLDAQAGLETAMGAVLAALAGINVVSGPGMLDFESCQSLEKLVIDNDICGAALRLVQGLQVRTPRLAEDLYGAIYDGDHFLTSPTTLEWFRQEMFSPSEAIDRDNYQSRQAKGDLTAGERAHRIVQQLLAAEPSSALPKEVARELERLMVREARKHGMATLPAAS